MPEQAWISSPKSSTTSTNNCESAERRILNRTLFTHITVDDEENAPHIRRGHRQRPRSYEHRRPGARHRRNKTAPHQAGQASIFLFYVDLGGRCGNKRRVVERLVSAWNHGVGEVRAPVEPVARVQSEVVTEPRRRPRTPLTEEEVDAIRTAHEVGISVATIASQYGIHRATVWTKTKRTSN